MNYFHKNKILQDLVSRLIDEQHVTSFIETGTFHGVTAESLAQRHPRLPIFTCETNETRLLQCIDRLTPFTNVYVSGSSSEIYISELIKRGKLGETPFFFLDAHGKPGGKEYWPLLDELEAILKLPKFIALIDDFKVLGCDRFRYETYNGKPCGFESIKHIIPRDSFKEMQVYYPCYKLDSVPGADYLCGHAFLTRSVWFELDYYYTRFNIIG